MKTLSDLKHMFTRIAEINTELASQEKYWDAVSSYQENTEKEIRELRNLLIEALFTIEQLVDQQAMPDAHWEPVAEAIRAKLAK